ncbi:MAG: phosphatase PAP2 family protein [Candidatus Gracilibacteria bacterium]|nr:phosphatase PAP2 family protein [Candidatus Gracilibacteria bacterium]
MIFEQINKSGLEFLNSLGQNEIISFISVIFADYPILFLPLFLVSMWIYYTYKNQNINKNNLLFIFYCSFLAIIINLIIQKFIHMERPEEYLKAAGNLLMSHVPDASFPSDHAAVSVSFLTGLFLFNYKKVGYFFSIFVLLMLISRIIVGVHWPFDIIVGSIIGVLSAFIIKKLIDIKTIKNINNTIIKYEPYGQIYNFITKK